MRLPYAMRTMTEEIGRTHEDAILETRNPDGFGIWRTLVLDAETTKAYTDLLDNLQDERIAYKDIPADQYHITFVSDRRADDARPFALDKAMRILQAPEPIAGVFTPEERREVRRVELNSSKVGDLREEYGYPSDVKKKDLIEDRLQVEGY